METIENLIKAIRQAWRPPPELTLSQWADKYAYLSAESSAEAGKWHTIAYQRGIMDAFTDKTIEQITFMKSARVGYTKIINHAIAYFIHQDPCPIMVVQPTIEDAEGYSKEEIAPMLRDTPVLRELVAESKSKDSKNTIVQKSFPGGVLAMVGANSPRGFRRVSRRVVFFDEVDGYPMSAGSEGDQIKLGIKRTEYYWNRKIAAGSTPTVDEVSRIQKLFNLSDQRRYFVPCPHCDHPQYLKWGGKDHAFGIKWPEGEPEKAYYVCEKNGCVIDHKDKRWMIEEADRRQQADPDGPYGWKPTANGNGKHAGFHIWAAYSYSPNATWGHLATEFTEAKEDPEALKTFVNTALGECWTQEYTAKLGAESISARAEPYNLHTVPEGGLILTAGIDVQDNRLVVAVRAWGEGEESWLVNWAEVHGDVADITTSGPWAQLDTILTQDYIHESGAKMNVRAACVDTGGHYTNEAYIFCRDRKNRHILAIKGSSVAGRPAITKPSKQDINHKNQKVKKGVDLWLLGVDTIKDTIVGRLKSNERTAGAGVYHFPLGLDEAYYNQLTAEKQVTTYKNGHPRRFWIKKNGVRNEALDCEVYAYAALQYIYTRVNRAQVWLQAKEILDKLEKVEVDDAKVAAQDVSFPQNEPPPTTSPPRPRNRPMAGRGKKGFVKGW